MQRRWRDLYPAPVRFHPDRRPAPEYLDDPDLPAEHRRASYRDLERLDRLPWQFGPLWRACRRLMERAGPPDTGIRILELGAGTGHTGARLKERAHREGLRVSLTLTDRDPDCLNRDFLRERGITDLRRLDWLRDEIPPCDVAVANLVLHHFEVGDARLALAKMRAAARLGGVVYDLNRSALAFHALRLLFPLWVSSPITVADAVLSVQQAFTAKELSNLARESGIDDPRVETHGFFRLLLWWAR